MSGNIVDCHNRGYYWHLVGKGSKGVRLYSVSTGELLVGYVLLNCDSLGPTYCYTKSAMCYFEDTAPPEKYEMKTSALHKKISCINHLVVLNLEKKEKKKKRRTSKEGEINCYVLVGLQTQKC